MRNRKIKKLNNKGSALVIAIIVIAFVSILTTILLYVATMNYHMKSTEYKTAVSFYGAETPLEELRTQLAWDVDDAAQKAYNQVMLEYGDLGSGRAAKFDELFYDAFEEIWRTRTEDTTVVPTAYSWKQGVEGTPLFTAKAADYHVVTDGVASCNVSGCTKHYHIYFDTLSGTDRLERDTSKRCFVLHGVRVVYTEDNYTSIIATDICINVPDINFSVEQSATAWNSGVHTGERNEISSEECVNYMNWTKQ